MRKLLRIPLRLSLGLLAKLVIQKHKPTTIVITGNSQTSISREYAFAVLNTILPTRRNLEIPEAEFSVPLVIFNYLRYPRHFWEWLWVIVKTVTQLIFLHPYKHGLVLELNPTSQAVMNYWCKIISPQFGITIGQPAVKLSSPNTQIIHLEPEEQDLLSPHQDAARTLGKMLAAELMLIEEAISEVHLPAARLRILPGKNGSTVIDATHYYFPVKLNSILELANSFEGRKIIVSQMPIAKLSVPQGWEVNPPESKLSAEDVVILLGSRSKIFQIGEPYLAQVQANLHK